MPHRPFQNIHVGDEQEQATLAALLRAGLTGVSWNEAKRLVQKRHVQINGNLCLDPARRLKSGDVVKVWSEPVAGPIEPRDIRVVYLDRHVAVVEKPAGVTSVRHKEERDFSRRRKQFQPTLDELLPRVIANYQHRGGRQAPGQVGKLPRVYPVHRLDRDTSGLMVFARTGDAEQGLMRQFKEHENHRVYLAIAIGQVEAMTIDTVLVDDRGDGKRGSATRGEDEKRGKRAVTHLRPLETTGRYTLVESRLETGRTHQIRIHLAEQGHPVCGDKLYHGPPGRPPVKDTSGATRHALHAAELGFEHPIGGEPLRFSTELPKDLARLWERLRAEPKGSAKHVKEKQGERGTGREGEQKAT